MRKKSIIILLSMFFLILSSSCSKSSNAVPSKSSNPYISQVNQDRISIMAFNLENLFDTNHDIGKTDYTFLPLSVKSFPEHIAECNKIKRKKWKDQCLYMDWSDKNLHQKMTELSKAILIVNNGNGPDILMVEEVENIAVLEQLRKNYLQNAGYNPPILIEGKDGRGIDVAVFSRLPLIDSPKLNYVPFANIPSSKRKDTRPILQTTFKLPGGDPLTIFTVHFPAPYHKTIYREESFYFLNQLVNALPKNHYAIAGGDFNVTSDERRKTRILKNTISDHWIIAHELPKKINAKGSYYYYPKNNWSFLDMLLLNKKFNNKNSTWTIDIDSIKVSNDYTGQNKKTNSKKNSEIQFTAPKGYQLKTGAGVSDHWPIYLEIVRKN